MKDEEIINFLKKDNNLMKDIQITAHLNILERAIIEKGWITEEKLNKLVNETTDLLLEKTIKLLNDEQKKTIQEILELNNFKKGDE